MVNGDATNNLRVPNVIVRNGTSADATKVPSQVLIGSCEDGAPGESAGRLTPDLVGFFCHCVGCSTSNEKKMRNVGPARTCFAVAMRARRDCVSLGGRMWKSSQKWS